MQNRLVHAIVVHLGLIPGSRVRQVQRLQQFIEREGCPGRARGGGRRFQRLGPQLKRILGAMGCWNLRRPGPHLPGPACRWRSWTMCTRGASRL